MTSSSPNATTNSAPAIVPAAAIHATLARSIDVATRGQLVELIAFAMFMLSGNADISTDQAQTQKDEVHHWYRHQTVFSQCPLNQVRQAKG